MLSKFKWILLFKCLPKELEELLWMQLKSFCVELCADSPYEEKTETWKENKWRIFGKPTNKKGFKSYWKVKYLIGIRPQQRLQLGSTGCHFLNDRKEFIVLPLFIQVLQRWPCDIYTIFGNWFELISYQLQIFLYYF